MRSSKGQIVSWGECPPYYLLPLRTYFLSYQYKKATQPDDSFYSISKSQITIVIVYFKPAPSEAHNMYFRNLFIFQYL